MTKRILAIMLLTCISATAFGAEISSQINDALKATEGAIVHVAIKYSSSRGVETLTGMGICYDAAKGEFITFAAASDLRKDNIKSLQIILPGRERKTIDAEYLGMRPESGEGRIQA
ncbi:unnamed protein product, partial [marine sediment metagenome]